jgi:uncharacterized protein (TIGR03435 family)
MNTAVHVAGWTLVHFLWQGAAIGLLAAAALRLLHGASAQSRYAVSCIALAAMLASPLATAYLLSRDVAPPGATQDLAGQKLERKAFLRVAPPEAAGGTFLFVRRRHMAGAVPVAAATAAGRLSATVPAGVLPALVVIWLAGVCVLLARLAGGWWRVARLHRAAWRLPASSWQPAADRLARYLGLWRVVRVVDAPCVDGPMVIGWLRPVVLLPVAAMAGLTPEQVQAILAHELAHVRRHDAAVNLLQAVAETLLFYHPAVWWMSSRIRIEREHCCDDVALDVSGDALGYASALAELESRRASGTTLVLAATGGSLVERVRRVLGTPAARPARGGATITVVLVLGFVGMAGGLQYLVARQPATALDAHSRPLQDSQDSKGPAWRMVFDHPSGQLAIRGFTARDLIRYAYQVPLSQVIGGPAWLDTDSIDLTTSVDHVPGADETPTLVRQLLEDRFGMRVHESTIEVPVLALVVARPDGALGPNLQPATGECFDQKAWLEGGAPAPPLRGEQTINCGAWDGGISFERVQSITMDQLASQLRHRFVPALRRDVVNRTGLEGPFDVSLEFFKPAAIAMAVTPAMRVPLRLAGFVSVQEALEDQLGLTLVPSTAPSPAIVIDEIRRPLDDLVATR